MSVNNAAQKVVSRENKNEKVEWGRTHVNVFIYTQNISRANHASIRLCYHFLLKKLKGDSLYFIEQKIWIAFISCLLRH